MSWQDVKDFYVEPDEPDYQCPCGCEDSVENCVYASICPQCSKKFYGNGYARRDQFCAECQPAVATPPNGVVITDWLIVFYEAAEHILYPTKGRRGTSK